ncbi:ABC transporter ATP-binding protein [Roseobacter sinensis]|uniref:ABC transporter ATP-binding protein/permease n=1 Tax=Roseobacter sinensis TaxID=2931391 RepID=A0ABT3BID5_9RHOB|nr:ABC transporter ATP-binding protein [Roseobacter sp. WL0113]MCV3273340.1 ABC transporter ATP-binding protein/permease [Roseobacter sp. WL0113]
MAKRGHRQTTLRETLPGLRRVVMRMLPYLRQHRMLVAGGSTALVASVLAKLLEPWPLKFVIDHVVQVGDGVAGTGSPFLDGLSLQTLLLVCAVGLVAVIAVRALCEYGAAIAFALAGNRVLTRVRADLFRHLLALPMAFHSRSKTGDLTMRLISDVGILKETAVTAALPLAVNTLILFGMVTVMLVINWQLTLIALMPLPLLWFSSRRTGRKIQTVSRKQRRNEGDMAATAAEIMTAMRTVQALGVEKEIAATFEGDNAKSMKAGVKVKRLSAGLERFVDVLTALSIALILYFGTLFVLDARMTPGDLLVFITYLKNMFRPVRNYAKYVARLSKATAGGERVIELLDTSVTIASTPDAKPAVITKGRIELKDVTFGYEPKSAAVLDAVSTVIEPGQSVVITGSSGTGKSTFVSLLMRLYDPDKGCITIDGTDLRAVELASLRRQISFVPQETLLFRASVRENLALGAGRPLADATIEAAARIANAHEFIMALPDGYETELTERGGTLSAGQRQRIALVRAYLRISPILILDEPTVGLDSANEAAVSDAIWRLAKGRTTLLITHDLRLATKADRVLCLQGGKIADDGKHTDLVKRGGPYARLWAQQRKPGDVLAAE